MNDNKRIAVNSIVIFARLAIVSIVSLVVSRLVLKALGASDFGLYNVVGGIVVILNVINTAMITTTYRFIAYELGKNDKGQVNKVFCTSFVIHCIFAVAVLVLGLTIGLFYVNTYLNVPEGRLIDARFILVVSVITTSISTLFVPFQGLLVAFEKFTVSAVIDICARVFLLVSVYIFLSQLHYGVRAYAIIQFFQISFTGLFFYLYSYRHYKKFIKLKISKDIRLYKDMFNFTGWTFVGATASVLKTQGSAAIINLFFGTIANAAFAIANQVESFILMFSRNLAQAAIPQITKSFSGSDTNRSVRLTCYISKYTFILMCIASFPILIERDFLLSLWLDEVPEGTSMLCALMILSGAVDCLGAGIPALVQATGKIKYFQIICHGLLILGLPIAFVFLKLGFNLNSILIVFIVIGFIVAFVRLYLLKKIINFDVLTFIKISYVRIFVISIPLIFYYFFYIPNSQTTIQHVFSLIFAELFLFGDILLLGLDRKERNILSGYIKKILYHEV